MIEILLSYYRLVRVPINLETWIGSIAAAVSISPVTSIFPNVVRGVISPYPTVAIVCSVKDT